MTPFESVLVPVDFSEPSRKAVTYGLTFAERLPAKLILAHIIPESSALTYAFPTETRKIEKDQYEKAIGAIDGLVPPEHAARVSLQKIVKVGRIEDELLAIAKDERVGLMVMGTHGRRMWTRWFLGSLTEHLLRRVPVPLLTVSHLETASHAVGLVELKHVLYATDLSESAHIGLRFAVDLARSAGAQLTVMHVVDDLDRMLWGPALLTNLPGERAKLVEELRNRLEELIAAEKPPPGAIEPLVVEGKPFQKIVEVAETRNMDMIILNIQSKSMLDRALLGSTAERVLRHARIPVLSLPLPAEP
jgi:nucleotide-binding universal stress UspA family protein